MTWNRLVARALVCALVIGSGMSALQAGAARQDAKAPVTAAAPLNLNVATATDLQKLPGIGPAMATRILEYRQKVGGFKKIEDLMNITGIGEKNFLKLKPLIVVPAPRTAER